jgi:hypothetical protein
MREGGEGVIETLMPRNAQCMLMHSTAQHGTHIDPAAHVDEGRG